MIPPRRRNSEHYALTEEIRRAWRWGTRVGWRRALYRLGILARGPMLPRVPGSCCPEHRRTEPCDECLGFGAEAVPAGPRMTPGETRAADVAQGVR